MKHSLRIHFHYFMVQITVRSYINNNIKDNIKNKIKDNIKDKNIYINLKEEKSDLKGKDNGVIYKSTLIKSANNINNFFYLNKNLISKKYKIL